MLLGTLSYAKFPSHCGRWRRVQLLPTVAGFLFNRCRRRDQVRINFGSSAFSYLLNWSLIRKILIIYEYRFAFICILVIISMYLTPRSFLWQLISSGTTCFRLLRHEKKGISNYLSLFNWGARNSVPGDFHRLVILLLIAAAEIERPWRCTICCQCSLCRWLLRAVNRMLRIILVCQLTKYLRLLFLFGSHENSLIKCFPAYILVIFSVFPDCTKLVSTSLIYGTHHQIFGFLIHRFAFRLIKMLEETAETPLRGLHLISEILRQVRMELLVLISVEAGSSSRTFLVERRRHFRLSFNFQWQVKTLMLQRRECRLLLLYA